MDYENIFEKACLIQLSTSIWQGQKMIEPGLMNQLNQNSDWLRGKKYLLNPATMGGIRTCAHQSRKVINQYALPFPITSIYLIPKDSLTVIDERLQYYKDRFLNKVEDFVAIYEAAMEEAQAVLGELFNETDYPQDIRSKFKFTWRYLNITLPGKNSILTPEIYQREMDKFHSMMDETREMAVEALRIEFSKVVEHMIERLTNNNGSPKVLSNSMFNRMFNFCEEFKTRNIFQDDELTELVEQAKSVIGGVSPYGLRYNDILRKKIQNDMGVVKASIDAAIEDIPRRKMRLAANDA